MDWVGTILTVAGLLLNIRKSEACWPVWMISNCVWLLYGGLSGQASIIVVNAIFFGVNAYGWNRWRFPE